MEGMRRRSPGQSGEHVQPPHTYFIWYSREFQSLVLYRAHNEHQASVSFEPRSLPRQSLVLYRAPLSSIKPRSLLRHVLHRAKSLVLYGAPYIASSLEPRSIRIQSLVLYGALTEYQASVCCCVHAVIFSVSVCLLSGYTLAYMFWFFVLGVFVGLVHR
jgi:hypothetical protein